jgi:hypothetical protein
MAALTADPGVGSWKKSSLVTGSFLLEYARVCCRGFSYVVHRGKGALVVALLIFDLSVFDPF